MVFFNIPAHFIQYNSDYRLGTTLHWSVGRKKRIEFMQMQIRNWLSNANFKHSSRASFLSPALNGFALVCVWAYRSYIFFSVSLLGTASHRSARTSQTKHGHPKSLALAFKINNRLSGLLRKFAPFVVSNSAKEILAVCWAERNLFIRARSQNMLFYSGGRELYGFVNIVPAQYLKSMSRATT